MFKSQKTITYLSTTTPETPGLFSVISELPHYLVDTAHHILIAGWAWHEQKQSE